ncbi:hypothetical protein SBF1_1110048 [Candidatus Desulfosporosinus infrequens]|uniref:Uncharacterized protein n=1 Tax=Candidatus Desulfosporosinus infrequens TaxID=2043169 RepID=A0A2U3JYI0_9FIRM|nr:hypothetical protein SBF1_1110048 [Candidatus Desulfosporosinus infrequens]
MFTPIEATLLFGVCSIPVIIVMWVIKKIHNIDKNLKIIADAQRNHKVE